ncbi:EKN1, related protein [Toxoplasma gondii TgCatPRC2]|uniref:Dynein axonemal assembly factor 4 n=10 Tax=Toxoplasma gondii TaxID=5811 RepID=A0A125YTL3_TOXGV|nr:hypothetical protein TGME49_295920 [Toxoplasma gondii ME49]EPR57751.1 hypothetical protein TGGT1_295920 [Toxoplasma gondii GT1]ESS29153.1 EKN1, related protein [Toxoplasma gondii VEG]KFG28392.1 EKN1, related protein [Toxoplasma gondii p89]KFG35941.1 EKN1, related protein [Toxoplasma gondii FOU]KFG37187.1 EKN1, related protein [Toxoplasma gondii GAB2-2007-GAL-DOM2]KFH05950.1 EKN1, related protein [Toxoplasma gondii MAS]KYK62531.1 EKN1, related protein [Toxoplasma gondii TgCatPRC2]PUA84284|eukprot:XP_018638540.1 hypothetical protein TGME49_295920 [Toxoplasma gondii ME49]
MPVPIKFEWSETSDTVAFALCIPVLSSFHTPDVRRIISPLYIRISSPPYFFEVDLFDEIDDETVDASLSGAHLVLRLRKKKSGIWKAFCATDNPEVTKESLLARREASIKIYERKQQERRQKLKERKYDKRKSAQEEQWRLDSGARQWLESQAESEKLRALHTLYNVPENPEDQAYSCKEITKDSHPPVASVSLLHARSINERRTAGKLFQVKGGVAHRSQERPVGVQVVQNRKHENPVPKTPFILDVESRPDAALEEHDLSDRSSREECSTPGECRLDDSAPGKKRITLTFTTRRRKRLPARGNKVPPLPKSGQHISAIQPPMDGRALREENSEWLKQKGDSMLKNGDLRREGTHSPLQTSNVVCSVLCPHEKSLKVHWPLPALLAGGGGEGRGSVLWYLVEGLRLSFIARAETILEDALKDTSELPVVHAKSLQTDLYHIKQLYPILLRKRQADSYMRNAVHRNRRVTASNYQSGHPSELRGSHHLEETVRLYTDLLHETRQDPAFGLLQALYFVNRALACLQAGHVRACVVDCDAASENLNAASLTPTCWTRKDEQQRKSSVSVQQGRAAEASSSFEAFAFVPKSEHTVKSLWTKARLRKAAALEHSGLMEDALEQLTSVMETNASDAEATQNATRVTKKLLVSRHGREKVSTAVEVKSPTNSNNTSIGAESGRRLVDASESSEIETLELLFAAAGARMKRQEYRAALQLYHNAFTLEQGCPEASEPKSLQSCVMMQVHRIRALANASLCLLKLNLSEHVVNVATLALKEIQKLKKLGAFERRNVIPDEVLKIELACISRRYG